jgi:phosphatidylglycerol lysyltransferase
LIGNFLEYCDRNGWRCGFHQASDKYLGIYKAYGMKHFKIGDEAKVDLTKFTLSGGANKDFRHVANKFNNKGYSTKIIKPPISNEVLSQLKAISNDWLKIRGRRERAFTLGYFEEKYIRSCQIFVVLDSAKNIVAFVNIIPSYNPGEATIDLMRHKIDAPNSTMEFLLIRLFVELQSEGYKSFSLGLSPMSGFHLHEKPSLEERTAHEISKYLNRVFSYEGLRAYKAKFTNDWEPRYLIYKNRIDLPLLIKSLNELTSMKKQK